MSRIGKAPVSIPAGVEVTINNDNIVVKGKLGELVQNFGDSVKVRKEDDSIIVEAVGDSKKDNAQHGLYRSLINNMVIGVSEGFTTVQELVGVGYRASNKGQLLELSLGFSHSIFFQIPDEVKVETESAKGKNPLIKLTSADKQLVGQVAAKIRSLRKPEPYKGKGVKFQGEQLRRKAGKTGAK